MLNGLNILLFSNTLKVNKCKKIIQKVYPVSKLVYIYSIKTPKKDKLTKIKQKDYKHIKQKKVNKSNWTMEKKDRHKKKSWIN